MAARGTRIGLAVLLAVAFSAVVAARAPFGIDYRPIVHPYDSARPQIDALIRLDFGDFFREQAAQGPVSIVVRAPFVALASASDQLSRYRIGVFVCLFALALVAFVAALVLRRRGSPLWHCALVAGVMVLSPPVHQTIVWAHPEELLATALVIAAVGAAATGRLRTAIVLAGVAVATKPWAAIALPVVGLVADDGVWRGAVRFVVAGAAVAVLVLAPMAIADTGAFRTSLREGNTIRPVFPHSVWWFTSNHRVTVDLGGAETRSVRRPQIPSWVQKTIRPAIIALGFVASFLVWGRGRRSLADAFGLLALLFLLRCVLEPHDHIYYHVPFVAAAALADGFAGRPPLIALIGSVMMSRPALRAVNESFDALSLEYLLWSLPVCAVLVTRLLRGRVGTARDLVTGTAAGLPSRHA